MGAATILALAAATTVAAVIIRELWNTWKEADDDYQQARSDEQWARQHRIDL